MDRAQFYLTKAASVSDPSILPKPTDRILEFVRKRPTIPNQESAPHEIVKSKPASRHIPNVGLISCLAFVIILLVLR